MTVAAGGRGQSEAGEIAVDRTLVGWAAEHVRLGQQLLHNQ